MGKRKSKPTRMNSISAKSSQFDETSNLKNQRFDLLNYCKAIERMMTEWYLYTHEALRQSSDLGFAREHFVQQILSNILPKSVIIGSGEIVDGLGNRSGQQDVIIYRSNFPIITSLTPVNTYLAEGVIATIEVKSDLSSGEPNNLISAIKNVRGVQNLRRKVQEIKGEKEQVDLLLRITNTKKYVIGYTGWKTQDTLLKNYAAAIVQSNLTFPDMVCLPGFCIVPNDGFLYPNEVKAWEILVHKEYPMAVFFHHLLKAVMISTGGSMLSLPGNEAILNYDLGDYFNFGQGLHFERITLTPQFAPK